MNIGTDKRYIRVARGISVAYLNPYNSCPAEPTVFIPIGKLTRD